jgi:hypothetical protein
VPAPVAAAPEGGAAPAPVAVLPTPDDPAEVPLVEAADPSPQRQVEPGNTPSGPGLSPPSAADDEVRLGPPGVGNAPPAAPVAAGAIPTDRLPQIGATPSTQGAQAPAAPPETVRTGRLPQVASDETEAETETAAVADPAPPQAQAPAAPAETVRTGRLPQVASDETEAETETATVADPAPPQAEAPAAPTETVRTGRLPQVGAASPAAAPDAAPAADAPMPPWQRFRAPAGDNARPPLGLVLFDPARALETEAALVDFPVPVTVALDPFDTDAPRRAQVYRAAGHEVVLAIDGIAPGATASDLEVLLEAWAGDFPEALGLIELPPGDGRRARALAPVVIPALQARGLALVAPDRGLSPMLAAGRAAGLPLAGLYRALDAADEDDATIRRQLDRAAFEAERLGRIAVFARADRPVTRAALLAWLAAGTRAGRVAPGPAGAVLAVP